MKIAPGKNDAPQFISAVEQVANGILRRHLPKTFFLIKIDNWFGSKWLGFSGKTMGAIGVWNKPYERDPKGLRIPPFVISQRRFAAPDYGEIDSGKLIHQHVGSTDALRTG